MLELCLELGLLVNQTVEPVEVPGLEQLSALLLERLAGLPRDRRGAQFVCALALVDPDGTPRVQVRGEVRGVILEAFRGAGGFGYDPLFEFSEPGHDATGSTFAELTAEQKARHSHRGRAIAALADRLGSGA